LPVSTEPIDLSAIPVTINPALKNVRLMDVLEVITKVTDVPLKYSIENYGVVFFVDPERRPAQPPAANRSEAMQVRTFKVNTNTFFSGLERTFRIGANGSREPEKTTLALINLQEALGIDHAGSKQIFYNDVTGIAMVRGTAHDLDVMAAAMETLGSGPLPLGGTSSSPSNHQPGKLEKF
jgi:hypothetical protein